MNETLLLALYYLTIVGLLLLMIVQGMKRQVELLSIRNLYLGGFIVYQLISPANVISTGLPVMFDVENIRETGTLMLGYIAVFLPAFLISYHKIPVVRGIARYVSPQNSTGNPALLIAVAICLVGAAAFLRIPVRIPIYSAVSYHLAIGFAAVACALAGWSWARYPLNLVALAFGSFIFTGSIAIAVFGQFGRRPLLCVCVGIAWGVYYCLGSKLKPQKLLLWSAPLILGALVVVGAFTSIRGNTRDGDLSATAVMQMMMRADVTAGIKDIFGGQSCGSASMWCLENYPETRERQYFQSVFQLFYQVIPRAFWEDKPLPLANHIAALANIQGVNQGGITLPPGIVGYAAAEGGIFVALIYGILFGGFVRFFDEFIRHNAENPYLVTVVASVTGHFLGLARGDLVNFTANILTTFFSTLLFMMILHKLLGKPVHRYMARYTA